MAGTWVALAVAALWTLEARRPTAQRPQRRLTLVEALAPAAAVAAVGVALGVVVALARPSVVTDYARAHTAFVVGAAVICVLAFALVGVVSAALTWTRSAPATAAGSDPAPTGA